MSKEPNNAAADVQDRGEIYQLRNDYKQICYKYEFIRKSLIQYVAYYLENQLDKDYDDAFHLACELMDRYSFYTALRGDNKIKLSKGEKADIRKDAYMKTEFETLLYLM